MKHKITKAKGPEKTGGFSVKDLRRRVYATVLLLLFQTQIFAGIVPDPITIGTRATRTATGIDQVDIARPNANGASYNAYKEFDVDEKGLILNNNIYIVVDTKLAGLIARNRNLDGGVEAKLIINDVTGAKASQIKGIIEIGGARADVVIANRNGLNINGGGFINVGNATLTTGRLVLKDGDLAEIEVDQGRLDIGSKGIDATSLESLDLSGKTVGIGGPVKGSERTKVRVSAGAQNIQYKTKKVTSKGKTYEGVAIDGKALGSMYSGKIDVISNDKGAGVNLQGDLISLDDMTLTSAGSLTTSGSVRGVKKVRYKAQDKVRIEKSLDAGEKAEIEGATIELAAAVTTGYENAASDALSLEAAGGNISNSGDIEAFGVAKLSGTSLDNSGNIVTPDLRISATELANSGAIQAAAFTLGADSLSNSGLIQTSEINLGANKLVNSGLIGVEKGIAASGKTFFNTGLITTPGALHLTYDHMGNIAGTLYGEKAVALEGLSLDNTDGVISTLGKLTIDVKDLLNRYGVVYTDGALTIATADLLDNTGGILVGELDSLGGNKLINEEGQILTNRALTLASLYTDNTKGEIFTPESITVSGDVFINDGGYLHTNKGITVNVSRASNREGFILSDGLTKELLAAMEESPAAEAEEIPVVETAEEERETAAYDGIRLMSNTLDNTKGTIRSLGDLVISADTTNDGGALTGANIDYTGNMSNKNGLVSGDAIVLKGNINNSAGSVSGDVITVKGNISGNSGGVLAGDVIEISGNTNNNGGEIQGNEIAFADGSVTNASGKILGGAVTADANIGTFNNDYGFTQGLGYVNLTNVSNAHGTITSDYSVSIANSGNLNNNYGIIEAKSADYGIEITAGGTLHNESGSIKSPGTVFVNTGGALVLDERIQGNTATSLAGSVISVNKNLYRTDIVELTARNGFALNGSLDAKQLSLNTGVVVTVNHALNGREGLYINAQSLTNTSVLSSGTMVALRLGEIKTKKVTNEEGNLVDEEYVDYKINNKLFNNGTITSQKDIYIAAGEMYNEEGHAISAPNGSIVLEGINLYNTGAVSRAGNSVSVGNGGQIKGKEVYISLSGSLINGFRDPGGLETRTDGTLKDNRTVSGGAVGAIAGTQTTNVSAGNVENRGNIGIAGSGTTFVGATGRIVNEKIGNYAGGNILGFDVYVDGNGGVVNTGALIRGTNSTSVRSLSGTILNQTTVKDGEIWFSHKEESATDTFIFYPNGDEIKKFAKAFENAGKEFPGMSGYFSKINLSDASYVDVTDLLASVPADVRAEYQRQKAAGKSVRIVAAYAPSQEIGGENGGSTTPWYSFQVLEAHEVVDLTGEGLNNIGTITSDGLVWLEGNNIENIGGLIAGNAGTTLEAKNDINDRSIAIGYRYSGSDKSINDGGYLGHGDWDVASGISNISGRIGAGGSTSLLAGRDINLVNSEIAAAVNAIFYADRYLNSLAVYDTVYRYDYDEWTEGGRLNRKKYKETFIVNNKLINGTEIVAGGNILFNMGLKDENGVERANKNRGVYLEETLTHATNGSLGGKSLGNIYVEGGLNSLYSYHQRIKKRSGISKLFGDAYDERTENSQEIYSLADIYSKKDIVYASDGKLTIKGADIYAEGSIHLSGKKGVSILPGTASSYYMEYLKKSGWTSSFSIGKGGISVGVGYAKSKSKYEQWNFDVIKSVIRADGDFIVVSEEGNYEQISTDINVKGNASITAKDIIIGDMASTVKIKQEQSSSYMGIGLSIGMPIVSTALALVDAAKNPERKMGGLNTVTAAVQARKAYNDFQSAANAMMLGGNYFAVNLSLSFSKNKSKYQSEAVNSVGSALNVGGNLTINGDNLHVTGSKIDVKGNIDYSILGNILVEAGRNAFSESSKSSGFSLGFSTNALDKENNFNPIADKNGILQLGYSTNKSWADGVNWNVSTITAGGNTNYNVGGDVIYKGAVVTTGSVSGTIGGNLYTETLQDYFNGGQKGYSLSVGIGFGKHKERGKNGTITESDNPYLQSLGVGYVTGHTETKLSNNPTKFTANGGQLDVSGKLTQVGSLIDGSFALNAGGYEFRDLVDIYKDSYFSGSFSIQPNVEYRKKDNLGNRTETKVGTLLDEDVRYRYRNQTRDVHATLGSGVTTNFDTQGVNRDAAAMVGEWEGTDIKETHVDLGLSMWLTEAGRELTQETDEQFKAGLEKIAYEIEKRLGKEIGDLIRGEEPVITWVTEKDSEGKETKKIKLVTKKIGLLGVIDAEMIALYEETLNQVDQNLRNKAYDEKLRKYGLSSEEIAEVYKWGLNALLNLSPDKYVELFQGINKYTNGRGLDDVNKKLSLILGSEYNLSGKMQEMIYEADKAKLNYLKTAKFKVGQDREITVKDIIQYDGAFIKLTEVEKKAVIQQIHDGLYKATYDAILSCYGIELGKQSTIVYGSPMEGAIAHFDPANNQITLPSLKIMVEKKQGENFNARINAGYGLTILNWIMHEGYSGHSFTLSITNGKIFAGTEEKKDLAKATQAAIGNDLKMIASNKGGNYHMDPIKKVFYFGYQGESIAYNSTGRTLKELITVVNEKYGLKIYAEYEYHANITTTDPKIMINTVYDMN